MKAKKVKLSVTCNIEDKNQYDELYNELGCSHGELISYLLRLNAPKFDKGMNMIERAVMQMLVTDNNEKINTNTVAKVVKVRFDTVPNFRTVLQVIQAYKEEIEGHNKEAFAPTYFDKARAKK